MVREISAALRGLFFPSSLDVKLHVLSADQRRQTLRVMLFFGTVAAVIVTLQTWLLFGTNPFFWADLVMTLTLGLLLFLLQRGWIRLVTHIFLWGILAYLLFTTFSVNFSMAPTMFTVYAFLIMVAGLFFRPRTALVYFWVMLALLFSGVALQPVLTQPADATLSATDLVILVMVLTVGLMVQRLFLTLLAGALERERKSAGALAERNRMLETTMTALERARATLEEDVSARTASLQASEARYRAVIENAPDGVVVFDVNTGRFVEANEEASRIFGIDRTTLLTLAPLTLPWRHASDLNMSARQLVADVAAGTLSFLELPIRRPGGDVVKVEINFATLQTAEQSLIIAGLRDVTARHDAEARRLAEHRQLQKIMSALPTGVTVAAIDEPGDVLWANPQIAHLLGYKAEEMIGSPIRGFYADPQERDRVRRQVAEKGFVHHHVIRARRRDGSHLWVRLFVESVVWEETPALLAFVENISELKEAEAALRQAQRIESLGMLAGGVAHDFNNLLVAMLAQASLAEARLSAGHPAGEHLARVVQAAEQASALTRQLLAYSGRGQFEVRRLDLNQVVEENMRLLRAAVPGGVQLDLRLDNAELPVEADAGQLQQIFMNLVINAAETVAAGQGVIGITTGRVTLPGQTWPHAAVGHPLLPGDYVTLEVADNGQGMDAATVERIFEPFFSTKADGRGLGLAAVIGIVRGHHGGIDVRSSPGGGSCFTVYLPAGAAEPPRPAASSAAALAASSGRGLSTCVLVVDDEELVRQAVADVLRSGGIDVVAAGDGSSAVTLYTDAPARYGLVLLDLSMPGMSGEETFHALRTVDPAVRVLISSGYSEQEAMRHFVGSGDVSFLKKPYRFNVLLKRVRELLDG